MQSQDPKISTLKAARRAIGFAAQGAAPSPTVATRVLRNVRNDLGEKALPATQKLLDEIISTRKAPEEKAAYISLEEINQAYGVCKDSNRHAESDQFAEEDGMQDQPVAPKS